MYNSHYSFLNFLGAARARDSVSSRSQCILSPSTAVIEIEQIPTLEAHSTDAIRPLKYTAAVGPPKKVILAHPIILIYTSHLNSVQASMVATLAPETLLTDEQSLIAAAAAEAVTLARAAVEVARDAAQKIRKNPFTESDKLDHFTSEANMHRLERVRFTGTESIKVISSLIAEVQQDNSTENPSEIDVFNLVHGEIETQEMCHSKGIAVRSGRQTERRAKRARAAVKTAAGVINVKCGASGKKKRSSFQEIDYSDPLRYLRGTASTSKLLSAVEELELSKGIKQDLLKLERLQEVLVGRIGGQPTFAQWATAAGVDQKTLRKRLNYGTFCKDKMIKSNIRLVIAIAKNYQNAGLSLQDLVQVHMVEATYRVREAKKQLYSENGRHPDNVEVAEATGLSMKRLETVLLIPKAPRSLDQKIGINQNLKPSEVIADPEAETSEEILIKRFMKADLNKVLDTLNPREKQVLRWRFGLENERKKTLQEIGKLMGVSRERIRQIESCAFRKLKRKKKMRNLRQYLMS
ncbi:hypothetical protein GW17_00027804 [Ensete ventricosum]|nr:hypothetical protein GW17_00027804 [Ensete ventricosum]